MSPTSFDTDFNSPSWGQGKGAFSPVQQRRYSADFGAHSSPLASLAHPRHMSIDVTSIAERMELASLGEHHSEADGDDLPIRLEYYIQPGWIPNSAIERTCQDNVAVLRGFDGDFHSAFLGVFDGHGDEGHHVAEWVADRLPVLISRQKDWREDPKRAFKAACIKADELLQHHETINSDYSGTTACFVYMEHETLHIGNVGDSRAVVGRMDKSGALECIELTKDHKPDTLGERLRIYRKGGFVNQVNGQGPKRVNDIDTGGLSMSRSIGDRIVGAYGVIPDPSCSQHKVTEDDKFLILATDGLWEHFSNEEVVSWVAKYVENCCVSKAIAEAAQERSSARSNCDYVDDTTVLVVQWLSADERAHAIHVADGYSNSPRISVKNLRF
eukprot:jgi/Mesvir1/20967/Mv08034-RA.1